MDRLLDENQPSQAANELAVAAALGNLGDLSEDQPDDLRETEDDSLSARLLNNAAALHLRGGEKEVALNLIEIEIVEYLHTSLKENFLNKVYGPLITKKLRL